MNISSLSFFDATNNVVRLAKTDINLFDMMSDPANDMSHLVKAHEPDRTPPQINKIAVGPPPNPDGPFTPMPKLSELLKESRESNIDKLTREREQFYAESTPVQNNNKAPVGFNILDDNIVMVSFPGGVHQFSASWDLDLVNPPNSALGFEAKVDNLKNLYEHLGESAVENRDVFDKALSGIIDDFIAKGGMYVSADKEGVADSIHAIFNGEEGKYTLDDLKTMAVLSFERVGLGVGDSGSEYQIGASFGLGAIQIEMARDAGKLSDAAYETVKDAFNKQIEDFIKQMEQYQEKAKTDSFGPKNVTYSPIRPELVYKSIDIMLDALKSDDFNQGIREAFKTLEDLHNAQRDNQLEDGKKADARFTVQFLGSYDDRARIGDNLNVSSQYFSEYLNRPEWTINGNPFSVSVTA